VVIEKVGQTERIERIWQLLEQVPDPEIPVVSIRELGILRDVRCTAGEHIEVVITPTYSGCPAMGQIEDDVKTALSSAGFAAVVVTQLAPAWTTDWMTDSAKDKLRQYGIAPPQCSAAEQSALDAAPNTTMNSIAARAVIMLPKGQYSHKNIPCPRCQSCNTTETSHFASTACKALYKCLDCLEPFDYFKPY
jgi:ring-1,2-phenylacetyl-CoA epoxidase subunit PaaD